MRHDSQWRVLAAGLAATAAVVTLSSDLSAQENPEPVAILEGYIAFEVGPTGPRIAQYDAADRLVPGTAVDLSLAGCRVQNRAALATLLDITTSPHDPDMFLVDNGLGFRTTSGNCAKSNGRVSHGETLVIAVRPGLEFVRAELNIEGKFSADLLYAVGDAPVAVGALDGFADLQSDTGDNGPDSGTSDNTIVSIAPDEPFTTITLSPTSSDGRGQISLENGGDSATPDSRESRFYLGRTYDFGVDCDGPPVVVDGADGTTIERVTFLRGLNKDGTCEPIGLDIDFELTSENGEPRDVVSIDPSLVSVLGNDQDLRARVAITWVVPRRDAGALRSADDVNLELDRQIEYPGFAPQPLSYCASADPVVGAVDPDLMVVADYDVVSPDDQPAEPAWCLLSDERVLEGDTIVQTIILDVGGDPKFF
ncbi:MAG TPA: hypothetical protein VK917_09135 [Ilumatobacter sp.]|nr:hypothetical protein [Ilumatobacter sp.]